MKLGAISLSKVKKEQKEFKDKINKVRINKK